MEKKQKQVQMASISVGYCTFKIVRVDRGAYHFNEYWLYRVQSAWDSHGRRHTSRVLDGKFEYYHDALETVAEYQRRYFTDPLRGVPSLDDLSV